MVSKAKEEKEAPKVERFEYALASSTLTIGDRVYTLGTPCDDMTPEELEKYRFSIRPAKK